METKLPDPTNYKSLFVNYLALILIMLSGIILVILVIMAWLNLKKDSFEDIEKLFTILLPVIGTWMGTILAFYFSKENFEAANQRVKDLVNQITTTDEKLQVLKASDVMIKLDTSILMTVKDENDFRSRKLSELIKKMEDSHSERMPILQEGTLKFIYLIYRTTIERFILGYNNGSIKINTTTPAAPAANAPAPANNPPVPAPIPTVDLTVNHMFQSDFQLIKDIRDCKGYFLPISATLDQVKRAMQDNTICQDVFITKTGSKDESVEGWITNTIIIEKAELFKKAGTKG